MKINSLILILIALIAFSRSSGVEIVEAEPRGGSSLIDWAATLPQIETIAQQTLKVGRVIHAEPITFAVCFREKRVIESMSVLIRCSTMAMPGDPKSGKNVSMIGFFYRAPYEFNGEWVLCVNQNGVDNMVVASNGWIALPEVENSPLILAKVLRSSYEAPLWPKSTEELDEIIWIRCVLHKESLNFIPDKLKLVNSLFLR